MNPFSYIFPVSNANHQSYSTTCIFIMQHSTGSQFRRPRRQPHRFDSTPATVVCFSGAASKVSQVCIASLVTRRHQQLLCPIACSLLEFTHPDHSDIAILPTA